MDVILPVYRSLKATRRCLDSVLADDQRPPGRIIVIDDASPEPELSAWLDGMARSGRIMLIRHARNAGFVASVNAGMREAAPHDVVLLNSDTEVPRGWLSRLAGHAYADPCIGTLSPFSNNASICSYPAPLGPRLSFGRTLAEIDAACRAANAGRAVPLPVTVGFCMYIRRTCLDETGPFDADTFGRGYDEENDFCLRASAKGWRHLLACDTFVYHQGSVSFASEWRELWLRNSRILLQRYPDYPALVAAHVQADEAGPCRFAATARLVRDAGLPAALVVAHRDLPPRAWRMQELLLTLDAGGATLAMPAEPAHPTVRLPPDRFEELAVLLRSFGVATLRVCRPPAPAPGLERLVAALGLPVVVAEPGYAGFHLRVRLPDQDTASTQRPSG